MDYDHDAGGRVIAEFIDQTPDGHAVRFDTIGGDLVLRRYSFAELAPLLADSDLIALMGLEARPGVRYLIRSLELRHFPPGTPRNELLRVYLLRWCGMLWSLVLFPWHALTPREAFAAIKAAGLRAIQGFPMCGGNIEPLGPGNIPAGSVQAFAAGFVQPDLPLGHVRVLENIPGHSLYSDPRGAEAVEAEMLEALEAEWQASR
jgi:hypothetical protein